MASVWSRRCARCSTSDQVVTPIGGAGEGRPLRLATRGSPLARWQAQRVARIGALGHARQDQARWGGRGQVLGRMHSQVGAAVEDRQLHLLHEGALSTDLRYRDIGEGVARRLHHDRLALRCAGQRAEEIGDAPGLPQGQW